MKITLLMPVFNGSGTLQCALKSIYNAMVPGINLEILFLDDNPVNFVEEINKTYLILKNCEITFQYFKSSSNLGYSEAMQFLYRKTNDNSGVIVYFAQDDLMSRDYFKNLIIAYTDGAKFTSRSFGMFNIHPENIVREMPQLKINSLFKISELEPSKLRIFMFSLSQLSGLSFSRKDATLEIGNDTFTAHIYPLISVALKSYGRYFDDYQVLCRTESSQTIFKKKIYNPPPTLQWVKLLKSTFKDERKILEIMLHDRARNYDGLYQILQYSGRIACYTELLAMISTDCKILFNPLTYIWAFLILLPKVLIKQIAVLYKYKVLRSQLITRNLKENLIKFTIQK
jgi:glycosyltransferase involved in cell wall biosynthesis